VGICAGKISLSAGTRDVNRPHPKGHSAHLNSVAATSGAQALPRPDQQDVVVSKLLVLIFLFRAVQI